MRDISLYPTSLYQKVIFLSVLLLVAVSCTPILGSSSRFVFVGLIFGLLYLWQIPKERYGFIHAPIVLILGYIIINVFYRFFNISDGNWGNSMNEFVFLICFPLAVITLNNLSKKQIKLLFWMIVCIILVNILENIAISILFPEINEYSLEYLDKSFLKSINAGGSNFYNMSFFFTVICLFVFLNSKEEKTRRLMFCSFAIGCVYIIVFSNKGSVVVFLLLSIVLLYIAKRVAKPQRIIVTLLFFAVLVYLLCILFQKEIVTLISETVASERLRVRMITIIDPDNMLANKDTISGRENLYLLSIETWLSSLSNFIFGIGDIRSEYNPEASGIGQHADLLDTFARYGIIGGGLLIGIMVKSYEIMKKRLFQGYKSQIQIIFILFLIYGCTKCVLVPEVGTMIFLLFPLTYTMLPKKNYHL